MSGTGHDHPHGPLESITHVHGGAPVLDIGGDVGALNVVLDDGAAGGELYLRSDDPAFSIHTGVWTRHLGGGHVTTALFCQLVEGTYWVLDADGDDRAGRRGHGWPARRAGPAIDGGDTGAPLTASVRASARRAMRSSAEAHRHTAINSSGTVVAMPPIHISAAADC